jgi:hypothetical protein
LRFERISGLSEEQIDEFERRVARSLKEPWKKSSGRPHRLALREALVITCGYLRQNIIEEAWADVFGVSQSTISRCIALLTPLVKKETERDQSTVATAVKALKGAIALVDGTLWPCWSWTGKKKLFKVIPTLGTGIRTERFKSSCAGCARQTGYGLSPGHWRNRQRTKPFGRPSCHLSRRLSTIIQNEFGLLFPVNILSPPLSPQKAFDFSRKMPGQSAASAAGRRGFRNNRFDGDPPRTVGSQNGAA